MQHLSFPPALTQAPDRVSRPVEEVIPVNQPCPFGKIKKCKRERTLPEWRVQSIACTGDSEDLVWLERRRF